MGQIQVMTHFSKQAKKNFYILKSYKQKVTT